MGTLKRDHSNLLTPTPTLVCLDVVRGYPFKNQEWNLPRRHVFQYPEPELPLKHPRVAPTRTAKPTKTVPSKHVEHRQRPLKK